ncbi:uncharacterized protein J8A68_001442 [[Candida] subhashii]|uniref:Protein transport protein SEC23 n=1 Tax=[Candida] subhashii TaxID=561895 RepID=A0A8J5QNZ7_9ASCO|nr:uncharacterized protein J8A68_001442 [[Candida] subhashii]KAG7665034.1 hypothetical protein J8A68_001442 [[Candida] subhashii]
MDFEAREDINGVRLSWSSLPKSKLQHERNIIPLGSLYTPLNNKSPIQVLDQSQLISCRTCRAILNPYVYVNNEIWTCQMCQSTNQIPKIFDQTTGQPIFPISLNQDLSTVEYQTGRLSSLSPIFFYVVDTCFEDEDLEEAFASLKQSLVVSLSLLPENALVGFISFGKHVKIHDLTTNDNISYTFNGAKHYTLEQIQASLGLLSAGLTAKPMHRDGTANGFENIISPIGRKFLQPVSIVEYQLTNIIDSLVPNKFPHSEYTERPERATGCAINIASLLLRAILGDHVTTTGGHLMVFIAGVCTLGPGKIVDKLLKEPFRSHNDIERVQHATLPQKPNMSSKTKSDTSLFKNAKKFYTEITKNLVKLGLSCNYFIGSYDQVGLFEMDEVCYKTGGMVVMCDSFSTAIFKQSFIKFFNKQDDGNSEFLDMGFNATLEVKVPHDLKIEGLIGNATALPFNKTITQNERMISQADTLGEGKTNSWKLCNVNPQSTYALYFEKLDSTNNQQTAIQYLFHYQHPNGEMRLRVTTIPINVIADSDPINLEAGFDQEASIVLVARKAMYKLQPDSNKLIPANTLIKQLDQLVIDFCSRFAVYNPQQIESFRLSSTYAFFPQFLFHLRRSPFINVFNSSPDETSYVRHTFMHEDVANSLLMIQPTLLSFDINTWGSTPEEQEPEPVLLDSLSLGHSKILLLDTFFQILIYHGKQVAEWRKAGYHEQEEYAYFKEFLEAPKREAMMLLMDRFPLPRFIDCDEGGSQARFLMAKLNPSTTYSTAGHLFADSGQIDVLTDDSSLQVFMENVQRSVVNKKK